MRADFVIARRVRLYADKEQTQLVGRIEVVGRGTYWRNRYHESWQARACIWSRSLFCPAHSPLYIVPPRR